MPSKRTYACPDCGSPVDLPEGCQNIRCPHCGSQLLYSAGLRRGGALIAVACPDCGAKTECPEDASSLVCAYCASRHLIAGESRVTRFYVPPRLGAGDARDVAGLPQSARGELVFVPYWRCRGMVYYFEMGRAADAPPTGEHSRLSWSLSLFVSTVETVRHLRTRALDQSLKAAAFPGGLQMLGTRLTEVNQEPYDPAAMAAMGRVLDPSVSDDSALSAMTEGAYADLNDFTLFSRMEHGNLVGGRLSMVWYPYWTFAVGTRKVAVDATGGGFVGELGAQDGTGGQPADGGVPVLVPARCPDCRGDLPADCFEAVRFCAACQAAWRLEGRQLTRLPVQVVRAAGDDKGLGHLPMWRLTIEIESPKQSLRDQAAFRRLVPDWGYTASSPDPAKPIHLYVPGWGSRIAPKLGALGLRYTRQQPELALGAKFSEPLRALFGPKEAEELALIVLLSVAYMREDLAEFLLDSALKVLKKELLLLPCRRDAQGEWIDAVSGAAVPQAEAAERFDPRAGALRS